MMKRNILFLSVIALMLVPGCLQYPEKYPNPDSVVDVVSDVAQDTISDSGSDADTSADVATDIDVDTGIDAARDTSDIDVDTVEPCLEGDDCDDENPCTVDDMCDALGVCVGTLVAECDDGLECTEDSCTTQVDCDHRILDGYCLVSGVCFESGDQDVETYGPCRICKPETANDELTADNDLPCSDNSICTENDKCFNGTCTGTQIVCDDENICTDDYCDTFEGCKTTNNTAQCSAQRCEGLIYYAEAVCAEGDCPTVTPEDCDDGNPCTTDKCTVSGCTHTVRDGQVCAAGYCDMGTFFAPAICIGDVCPPQESTFCDDENICTEDYCTPEGGCLARADNTVVCGQASCDGNTYTPAVTCNNSICPTPTPVVCADTNVCTDDTCTLTGCLYTANTAFCEDGNPCTENDYCDKKSCKSGFLKDCDDGLDCTFDSCDTGSGECKHDHPGYCVIEGVCRPDMEENPENSCEKCDIYTDGENWSPSSDGLPCDDYPFGSATCSGGSCVYECEENRGDCDGQVGTGCEVNLRNDPDFCGNCETDCGTQVCSWGTCADTCAGDLELCGDRCQDTNTSLEHCGGCDSPCAYDNAVTECQLGSCVLISCVDGYYNVDTIADNGCECHSTGLELCDGIDNDCNGQTDDVDVSTVAGDPENCGDCGNICNSGDHSVYGFCSGGNCYEAPCTSGFWDNDKNPTNTCEYECQYVGVETCGNGVDEDCDGVTDEDC